MRLVLLPPLFCKHHRPPGTDRSRFFFSHICIVFIIATFLRLRSTETHVLLVRPIECYISSHQDFWRTPYASFLQLAHKVLLEFHHAQIFFSARFQRVFLNFQRSSFVRLSRFSSKLIFSCHTSSRTCKLITSGPSCPTECWIRTFSY